MMNITHSVFWGSIVILIGIIVILKMFPAFRSISIGRIMGGIILIYFGLSILIGDRIFVFRDNVNFRYFNNMRGFNRNYSKDGSGEKYDIVFGTDVIDLRNMAENEEKNIKINVAFSSAQVKIDKETKIIINGNVAFGSVNLPQSNKAFFGHYNYSTPDHAGKKGTIYLKSDVAFGSLDIALE